MDNKDLMLSIVSKLAEIDGAENIEQEQLVKCLGMVTGFMMLEVGVLVVETDELDITVSAK